MRSILAALLALVVAVADGVCSCSHLCTCDGMKAHMDCMQPCMNFFYSSPRPIDAIRKAQLDCYDHIDVTFTEVPGVFTDSVVWNCRDKTRGLLFS